jgi:hypothetical protein
MTFLCLKAWTQTGKKSTLAILINHKIIKCEEMGMLQDQKDHVLKKENTHSHVSSVVFWDPSDVSSHMSHYIDSSGR